MNETGLLSDETVIDSVKTGPDNIVEQSSALEIRSDIRRKFLEFRRRIGMKNILNDADTNNQEFWFSRDARKLMEMGIFFSGYQLGEYMQNISADKYDKIVGSLLESLNRVGLEPDTNFFQWQMSDYFGAVFYPLAIEPTVRSAFSYFGDKQIFGKDNIWWDSKTELATAFTAGVILTSFEVFQAVRAQGRFDIADMTAYIAGLGIYLSSEKIFQEYLLFKGKYGSKLIPFFGDRKEKICAPFKIAMRRLKDTLPRDDYV